MIRRRPIEVFSLSFLDCLCCGFGAILLLFVLSIGSGPHGVEREVDVPTLRAMQAQLAMLEADVADQTILLEAAINSERTSTERDRTLSFIQEQKSKLVDLQKKFESLESTLRPPSKPPQQSVCYRALNMKTFLLLAYQLRQPTLPSLSTPQVVCVIK